MQYVFPAIFTPEPGLGFSIHFPDLESCYTQGDDLQDGYKMAGDILNAVLCDMEDGKEAIPPASSPAALALSDGEFTALIGADTLEYRKRTDNRAVKKTLSIPCWLNAAAERENINFSQALQEALKSKLGIV